MFVQNCACPKPIWKFITFVVVDMTRFAVYECEKCKGIKFVYGFGPGKPSEETK